MKISDALCVAAVAITAVAVFSGSIATTRRTSSRRSLFGNSFMLRGSGVKGTVKFNSSGRFNVRIYSSGSFSTRFNIAQALRIRIETIANENEYLSQQQIVTRACCDITHFTGKTLYSI